jgi:hypothetical protein
MQTAVVRIFSSSSAVRRLAEGNIQDYDTVINQFSDQATKLQVEFITLVSSTNFSVQANAFNDRRGDIFNPSGIAAKAMEVDAPIAVTIQMDYSDFEKEGAPRFL